MEEIVYPQCACEANREGGECPTRVEMTAQFELFYRKAASHSGRHHNGWHEESEKKLSRIPGKGVGQRHAKGTYQHQSNPSHHSSDKTPASETEGAYCQENEQAILA